MINNLNPASLFTSRYSERQELEVQLPLTLAIALALTFIVYAVFLPIKKSYIGIILYERGFTQFLTVYLAGLVVAIIFMKLIKLRLEFRALKKNTLPKSIDLTAPGSQQVISLQQSLGNQRSLIANRCSRILATYVQSGTRQAATEFALEDSTFYSSASESSYSFPRILVWAIPLLGFIGTVIGISSAVNGFSGFLEQSGEIEQIKQGIGNVTSGLSVAFDTTLLALLLSVLVMIPLVLVEKFESRLLLEVDIFINDQLLPRLKQSDESLDRQVINEAVHQAFEELLPSPEVLIQPAQEFAKKAAEAVAKGFVAEISKVQGMNAKLIQQMSHVNKMAVEDRQQFIAEFKEQQERSQAIAQQVRAIVDEIKLNNTAVSTGLAQQAEKLTQQLAQVATALESRVLALEECASKVAEIARLHQSLDLTIQNLEQTAQLENVLEAVKDNLAQLRPVLQQMNKPRRITLVEQDNGIL